MVVVVVVAASSANQHRPRHSGSTGCMIDISFGRRGRQARVATLAWQKPTRKLLCFVLLGRSQIARLRERERVLNERFAYSKDKCRVDCAIAINPRRLRRRVNNINTKGAAGQLAAKYFEYVDILLGHLSWFSDVCDERHTTKHKAQQNNKVNFESISWIKSSTKLCFFKHLHFCLLNWI